MFGTDTVMRWQSQVQIEVLPPPKPHLLSPIFIAANIKNKELEPSCSRGQGSSWLPHALEAHLTDLWLMKIFALFATKFMGRICDQEML